MCWNTSNLVVLAFSFSLIATSAKLPGQEKVRQAGKPDPRQTAAQPASTSPRPGRMFVVGHVLDAKGQPVPGAAVAAFARIVRLGLRYSDAMTPIPIGNAIADESGQYRIDAPRTSASRHEFFGVDNIGAYPPEGEPYLIARKRLEWPKGALEQSLDIVLPRGILIHGNKTVAMVVTPGPTYIARTSLGGKLAADDADVCEMDTVNYRAELVTDAHGKLKLPALIPGANYRFVDWSTAVRGEAGPKVRKEFSVKPGETLDLGDLVIEKPHAR
jgi:hypothetical protein